MHRHLLSMQYAINKRKLHRKILNTIETMIRIMLMCSQLPNEFAKGRISLFHRHYGLEISVIIYLLMSQLQFLVNRFNIDKIGNGPLFNIYVKTHNCAS